MPAWAGAARPAAVWLPGVAVTLPFSRLEPTVLPVPLVDLRIQHDQVAAEVSAGWARVVNERCFVLGPDVDAFEREFARFARVAHCVAVANGTDALELALRARGVGPGDEVILPANAFTSTAEAVMRSGARPVLVDCDPRYLLIDPGEVVDRLTPRTRAVVGVDLFGQPAPLDVVMRELHRGIDTIEVASHAPGASRHGRVAGSLGAAAVVGFHPENALGAYGDAGAVLTDNAWTAGLARSLRNHGGIERHEHELSGMNSRLDTLQAVVLRAKLRRLARWNDDRKRAAQRYHDLLRDEPAVLRPATMPGNDHVWHRYVVRIGNRDEVVARLNAAGIDAAVHQPVPLHRQPAFAGLGHGEGDFPVAESAAATMLSLPLFPGITEAQQDLVVAELLSAVRADAA
jgi:dTDP-4-amino-4,6-dideoxygalactose transaminase